MRIQVKALLLSTGTLISRVLGLLREMVLASYFGTSKYLDIFYLAYTVPSLFRRIFGEEMFERAVVPRIFSLYSSGRKKEGRKVLSSFFAISLFVGGALLVILYATYPYLCRVIGPGVSKEDLPIFLNLTRQLIPFALIIGIAAILGSFLLFGGMTFVYGISSSFLNVGIIAAVLFFGGSLVSLPIGVLLGGCLVVAFQLPFFLRVLRDLEGGKFKGYLRKNESFLRQVALVSLYSVALKSAEVVDKAVGNLCGEGVVSGLNFGFRLVSFPLAIFGLAISRSVMRFLAESSSEEEMTRWTEKGADLACAVMPAVTVFCFLFSREAVAFLFMRGRFDIDSLIMVSSIFAIYSLGLLPQTLMHVISRFYSVMERNAVPAAISSLVAAVNVLLDLLLYRKLGYTGIAVATSTAYFVGAVVLSLHARFRHGFRLRKRATIGVQSLVASLLAGYGAFALTSELTGEHAARLFLGGVIFLLVWGGLLSSMLLTKWKRYEFLMCGGGTGGHVFPLVAVSHKLPGEHLYVGTLGRRDGKLSASFRGDRVFLPAAPFSRKNPLPFIASGLVSTLLSAIVILKNRPKVIFSTGGYGGFAPVFAGSVLRSLRLWRGAIVLHEQNAVPGRATKYMLNHADLLLHSFPQKTYSSKELLVGYPVRGEFHGEAEKRDLLLVVGGSQGASLLNENVWRVLDRLTEEFEVVHSVGFRDYRKIPKRARENPKYHPYPFIENIHSHFLEAKVVITRGGAGGIFESMASGAVMVVVPKSGLPQDHQTENGLVVETLGYGKVVYELTVSDGKVVEGEFHEELLEKALWAKSVHESVWKEERKNPLVEGLDRIARILSLARDGKLEEARLLGISLPLEVKRDRRYWLYTAGRLLSSPHPDSVNAGIKVAGARNLKECERAVFDAVIKAVPSNSLLCRIFGSGPTCPGFVRRNGVKLLFRWNPSLYSKLFLSFTSDPYWEVRKEVLSGLTSARAFPSHFNEMLSRERNFEVTVELVRLAGACGWREDVQLVLPLLSHRNPFIRKAVLSALVEAVKRGVLSPEEAKRAVRERFYTPSRWFEPRSPLLEELEELLSL